MAEKLEVEIIAKDEASKVIRGLSDITAGFGKVALGVAVGGLAALTTGLGIGVKEWTEYTKVETQQLQVLQSTGGAAGVTKQALDDLTGSLIKVTAYGEEEIMTGENLLLTFTNIGKNVFPQATETMLDMSTALGQDLKSSAIQLGKALQDPILGVSALRRVGVNFTDKQKDMITALVNSGKSLEAQKLILKELQTEFGGSAKAAGKTFPGQLTIMKNRLLEVAEGIAGSFLPAITGLIPKLGPVFDWIERMGNEIGHIFLNMVNSPDLSSAFDQFKFGVANLLPPGLASAFSDVMDTIKKAIGYLVDVIIPFVKDHAEAFKGAILGIGAVLAGASIVTEIQKVISVLSALTSPIGLIITVAGLLGVAWNTNFLGIRDTLTAFWEKTGKPIFEAVVLWLQTNIPVAISTVSNFWTGTLQPAMTQVFSWITTNLVPIFISVRDWLATNIPAAIETARKFWVETLQPALNSVWSFINTYIVPIFDSLVTLISVTLQAAVLGMSKLWNETLKPALDAVWKFINDNVLPILRTVGDFIDKTLGPIVSGIANGALTILKGIFVGIRDAIQWCIDKVKEFISALSGVPNNPTPSASIPTTPAGQGYSVGQKSTFPQRNNSTSFGGGENSGGNQTVINITENNYGSSNTNTLNAARSLAQLQR